MPQSKLLTLYPFTKITGNDRRCKYLVDGFVEDLSTTDLKILATLEVENPVEFGRVGYRFRKQFNEGWYDGIVVKVLKRGGKICLRRLSSSHHFSSNSVFLFFSHQKQMEKIEEFITQQTMTLKI